MSFKSEITRLLVPAFVKPTGSVLSNPLNLLSVVFDRCDFQHYWFWIYFTVLTLHCEACSSEVLLTEALA